MSTHRISIPGTRPSRSERVDITGPEAHHAARVKRLTEGDTVELLDGRGWRGLAAVIGVTKAAKGEWVLAVEVRETVEEEPTRPQVHVLASPPKGERLEEMIDQLSQAGAASWSPLVAARTVVSPRAGKMLRAERVASEAAKQCGRLWTMSIGEPVRLADALARTDPRLVLADPSGGPFTYEDEAQIALLVGPEGGFAEEELGAAAKAGASVCRFGRHVMRVETAAVVATGVILDAAARHDAAGATGSTIAREVRP